MASTVRGFSRKATDGVRGTLTLGEVQDIEGYPFLGVVLATVAGATANVQVSNDGTNYVTIGSVTAATGSGSVQGIYPYRYVKVVSTGTVGHIGISACRSGK